jgi:hypothetical protein
MQVRVTSRDLLVLGDAASLGHKLAGRRSMDYGSTLDEDKRVAMTQLEDQLKERRQEIATDAYSMSIGELVSLYSEDELDIHPEFQRVYRWGLDQKTRLVESILLGIPLPSVFVAQREDGVWDVVDGVQRLSTILEFMGVLKGEDGEALPPLELTAAPYLSALQGVKYDQDADDSLSLSSAQRLDFKRAKMDVKIIKRESDPRAKFDLFRRLNTYGSPLTRQESRNCMLVSLSTSTYEWLRTLADREDFQETTSLPEQSIEEQYHHELALRFIGLRNLDLESLKTIRSLHDFLDDRTIELGSWGAQELEAEQRAFEETFQLLRTSLGSGAFKKYNPDKEVFEGRFSITAFELLAIGIGSLGDRSGLDVEDVTSAAKDVWQREEFRAGFSTGVSADSRIRKTVPLGRSLFA